MASVGWIKICFYRLLLRIYACTSCAKRPVGFGLGGEETRSKSSPPSSSSTDDYLRQPPPARLSEVVLEVVHYWILLAWASFLGVGPNESMNRKWIARRRFYNGRRIGELRRVWVGGERRWRVFNARFSFRSFWNVVRTTRSLENYRVQRLTIRKRIERG